MGAPVRLQKAVSRSKENAAVERREARRSALWIGNPVRWRDGLSRKASQRSRRSAAANFGAPLPSDGGAKGSKPTIWHDSPPGCAARRRCLTPQRMYEGEDDSVEVCALNSLRHARPCAGHPCLALRHRKAWMAGTSPAMTNV